MDETDRMNEASRKEGKTSTEVQVDEDVAEMIKRFGLNTMKSIRDYITGVVTYSSHSSDSENTAVFRKFVRGKENKIQSESARRDEAEQRCEAWRREVI